MSGRRTPPRRSRRRTDVLSLVLGLLAIIYGAAILWTRMVHPFDRELISIAAPAALVVIGVIGLLAGGNRS
ncbi:hypothetical protein [Raineyella fluvialis]|uniref:Uncharacterized protein n=1 Tax=Raineyella fluvialis TaxID=2662261 RepID=A0A5Q2F6E0_9ACTN|nr:hypothetical protein [Raineyella fluvialis]QGF22540.1 hypothetical protein Rai3103_01265 [Raineyella fluvialis]